MIEGHIRAQHGGWGTQAAAAKAWGVTATFISLVVAGKRLPNEKMMADAGIELVAVYTHKRPKS